MVNTRRSLQSELVLILVMMVQQFDFVHVEKERGELVNNKNFLREKKEALKRGNGLKILKPR